MDLDSDLALYYLVLAVTIVVLENQVGAFGFLLSRLTGWHGFEILGQSVTMVIGFIFVLCVMLFRRGIVGELEHRWFARQARRETGVVGCRVSAQEPAERVSV